MIWGNLQGRLRKLLRWDAQFASGNSAAVLTYKITVQTFTQDRDQRSEQSPRPGSLWGGIAADVKALPDVKDIRVYKRLDGANSGLAGDGGDFWKESVAVSIPAVYTKGAYLGKTALDVLTDIVKARLSAKELPADGVRRIEIRGPNGEVATLLK